MAALTSGSASKGPSMFGTLSGIWAMLDFNALRPNHKAGVVLTISQLLEGGDGRHDLERRLIVEGSYARRVTPLIS